MTNDPARYPQRLFWLCFAVAMVDGFDTLVVSFIAPAFAAEWSLSGTEVGQVFGIGLVGAAIGGIIGGRLADRAGRKKVLLGSVLLFSVLTVCCALAPNREILMALRFLAGLGLGAAIPTVTALTAETLPPEQRTAAVTRMFLGFPLGAVIGGALCAIMVEPLGWRSAFWLGGILGLILLPLLARQVVEPPAEAGRAHMGASMADVLGHGRALPAAMLFVAAFSILLVSYFLINWTPSILAGAGVAQTYAILGGVLLNLGGVVGVLALTSILDRSPYRLVAATLLVGAVLVFALGANLTAVMLAVPLVIATGMTVIGGQLTLPALGATLFPKEVRATGIGLTMGIGRIGSIIGPTVGGILVDARLSPGALFGLIAIPVMVAGIALLIAARGVTPPASLAARSSGAGAG